ncbi:hypothetical protein QFZ42_004508 [Variovorax paradoxus]|uniref:DUF3540 domain-containing protein n=1 Tax=Variovorax paradoxus TaxID=34073 RepID=UPI002792634E|nr:DUF3540 domain-containing protein [Variovorax paradoxus]MDQ0572674.1 hypothetical protein [Variovorax paradoxus]
MTATVTERRTKALHKPNKQADAPAPAQAGWHRATALSDPGSAQGLRLRLDGEGVHEISACQAFSCLVAVQAGDIVAALLDDRRQCWVMAVLERSGAQDVVLQSQGRLELNAPTISANAQELLHMAAPQVRLSCEQADVMGERLNLVGGTIKAIGAALSTLFDRVHHHSKQYMRSTDGLDRTLAGHMELQARQLLQIHGEHTLVEGEQLVKARGAQIHFG